jgi:hypothetical protein
MNCEPGVELLQIERTSGGGRARLLRQQRVAEREADDQRAARLDEVAARAHDRTCMAVAARRIAFTIRG